MFIVERIKEEAKKNKLSLSSIEKSIGLSSGAIGKWNISNPSAENLYNVARLLNCSMEYLLIGKEEILSDSEKEWLTLYRQLSYCSPDVQNECIGFIKGYIARGTTDTK